MRKLPFYSRSAGMTVVDYFCRCGGKWSQHEHDMERGESHGGGCQATGCPQFTFDGYVYEQARIEHEAIRPEVRREKATNGVE